MASIILWGPCGVGKTTLARIIAHSTKAAFKEMGATTHGVADVKKAFEDAKNLFNMTRQRTIVFLDEIHRFTKAQQDVFLPYVERGTITLIGATTENPSFRVNAALLSRCRVLTLNKLSHEDGMDLMIKRGARIKWYDILDLALSEMPKHEVEQFESTIGKDESSLNEWIDSRIEEGAIKWLIDLSDGDGRSALNTLEIALQALSSEILRDGLGDPAKSQSNSTHTTSESILERLLSCKLTAVTVKTAFQKTHLQYDRQGEEHYNLISALHKSIRGGDEDASLYWLGRMLVAGEDPLYIARRLIRLASEDIGLADSSALPLATATYQACQMIGMPECEVNLAHCVTYMARAPKSIEVYHAYGLVKQTVQEEYAYPVPIHLRNAPTGLMKDLGYGAGYKYNPGYAPGTVIKQEYLPKGLERRKFFGQIQYMTLEPEEDDEKGTK
ncbi:Werner helicase interacting protein 1 [Actinomortierella wolfii]|nr:Werner helicase interacting protein 1 [Actinomortierella wolfii]